MLLNYFIFFKGFDLICKLIMTNDLLNVTLIFIVVFGKHF